MNKHGDFIWYELMTSDADAAQRFYGAMLEWSFASGGISDMDYRIINAPEHAVGGLMPISPEMAEQGARPGWLGYIGVDDVDKCIESIVHGGGTVHMPATDIPGVGRFALVADPQGAPFYIMRGASDEVSMAFAADHPRIGHCAWNELITSDQAAALHFYGVRFGWVKDGEMDMGPMGSYDFLRHGFMMGAMMKASGEMGPPHWNFYFRVVDIDVAYATAKANGGTIVSEPHEVPGGDFVLHGIDPQGAFFALVGARA